MLQISLEVLHFQLGALAFGLQANNHVLEGIQAVEGNRIMQKSLLHRAFFKQGQLRFSFLQFRLQSLKLSLVHSGVAGGAARGWGRVGIRSRMLPLVDLELGLQKGLRR